MGSLLVVMAGTMTNCSAKTPITKSPNAFESDTLVVKELGDSICSLLERARKIRAFTITLPGDSLTHIQSVSVPTTDKALVKFIVTDPANYETDVVTYGKFAPQFGMSFSTRKAAVFIYYDFGLHKWQIKNDKGDVILERDLKSRDMFRYARIIFPDNDFFNALYQEEQKNNKPL